MIKSANTIVNELIAKSHYKPLRTLFFCKDFLNLMLPDKRSLIAKVFVKNNIFHIITRHNTGYQELNHDDTKKNIKFLIKLYAKKYPLSAFDQICDLKIFTQRYNLEVCNADKNTHYSYLELSKGEFKNCFEDEKLFKKFEDLRELIKKGSNLD